MVRVIQPDVPAEYEELWNKIMRWFERNGVPIWCRQWFQNTRRGDRVRKEASPVSVIANAWNALSPVRKIWWDITAHVMWGYARGYRFFTTDWIYREVVGLYVPQIPSFHHQLFGMKMANPGGTNNVYMRRDDKDLVGQLTVKFAYKKAESVSSVVNAFRVTTTGYYFTQGSYDTDVDEFEAPAGNVAWNTIERTFGVANRKYFHYKIVFSIENYNAEVSLDNIVLSDQNGEFYKENFYTKRYRPWVPVLLYRKRDWVFSPTYSPPNFTHLYFE